MFCGAAASMLLMAVPTSPSLGFIRIHHFPLPGSAFLFYRKKQGCHCCLLHLIGSSAPSVAVCSVPGCGGGRGAQPSVPPCTASPATAGLPICHQDIDRNTGKALENQGSERLGLHSLMGPREIVWFVFQILDCVPGQIQSGKEKL